MADTNTTGSSVDKPIENLEVNGTKYVIMPKKDNNGNVIVDTYLTKTDASNTYLGKTSAAASANKLTVNAGSATVPTYFTNGVPTACTGISVATVTATTTLNIPGGKIWIG